MLKKFCRHDGGKRRVLPDVVIVEKVFDARRRYSVVVFLNKFLDESSLEICFKEDFEVWKNHYLCLIRFFTQ